MTQLGDIGELRLLELLRPYLGAAGAGLLVGPGDDAAVWQPSPGMAVVSTTDSLVEEVHFHSPQDEAAGAGLGWKLLAISLSDLAAMGARAGPAFVALALPPSWPVGHMLALYQGLQECAGVHQASLAGGNLSSASVAVLTSTCLGEVDPGLVLRRPGAQPGWQLAVTGRLGGATAAVRTLHHGDAGPAPGVTEATRTIWEERLRRPQPRMGGGQVLARAGVSVAIDVSDGLFLDAGRLLGALPGGAGGAVVDLDSVPVEVGIREAWPEAWAEVVGGGEDYELLFAGPPAEIGAACRELADLGVEATVIGAFDQGPGLRVRRDGREEPAPVSGHEHF